MVDLLGEIAKADENEIENILQAVWKRCSELFPDRDVSIISLPKFSDRNEQIDRIIDILQEMKTS